MASTTRSRRATKTLPFTETRQNLSEILNRVARGETRFVVEKNGVPVGAIVSTDDLRRLDAFEERRSELFQVISEISRAFADVPDDELERELAKAQAEAREELRREREAANE